MLKFAITTGVLMLLLLLLPIVGRKYSVPLMSNGKILAIATRPYVLPWRDNEFTVSGGKEKLFSLWGDAFHIPIFIHPFTDGQRFLCIDHDDTAVLVFIVDLAPSRTSATNSPEWPPDDFTRGYLAQRATNVVMNTRGLVRLPTHSELQEVSSNLANMTPSQFRTASFPTFELGVYKSYWPKEALLAALHPDHPKFSP